MRKKIFILKIISFFVKNQSEIKEQLVSNHISDYKNWKKGFLRE